MADIIEAGLRNKITTLTQKLGELAYERLRLSRRIEEIDKIIAQIEGAQVANSQVKKDLETQAAVDAAKAEPESDDRPQTLKVAPPMAGSSFPN